MDTLAREAADQLVRLTRLVVDTEEVARASHRRRKTPATPRTLRHNGAELTPRELQVFSLLIKGECNARLARTLEISERAMEVHLRTLLREFGVPEPPGPPEPRRRYPRRRTVTAILAPVTGTVVFCGAPQALLSLQDEPSDDAAAPAPQAGDPSNPLAAFGVSSVRSRPVRPFRPATLPTGVATATSFWDPATAQGGRMSYHTLASPYWPLGTKVRVGYRGRAAVGVVEDFGPAGWAVAQHEIPAIIDISERMMADLTGTRADAVRVRFEVLEWGQGEVYRDSGPGYELATGGG